MTRDRIPQPSQVYWIMFAFFALLCGFVWSSFFQVSLALVFLRMDIVNEWWFRLYLHASFVAFIPVHALLLKDARVQQGNGASFLSRLVHYGATWLIAPVLLGAALCDRAPEWHKGWHERERRRLGAHRAKNVVVVDFSRCTAQAGRDPAM